MSTKRKAAAAIAKPVVKPSAKAPVKTKIDEARTAVSTGSSNKPAPKQSAEPIEISSDSDSQYSSSDNEDGESGDESKEVDETSKPAGTKRLRNGQGEADEDAVMQDGGENSDGEPTSPTFGDLVRGNSTIDVPASLAAQAAAAQTSRHPVQRRSAAPISATSLGTVLNQALRTDDADLLESCLQTTDTKIIENTINRMDSALAGSLLSKLAARMHRRPGRAFGLMRWMQWTLVAHGGALVARPDLIAQLGELSRVLEERSRGLPSLLALKGKLDMLDSQMKFRKSIKAAGAGRSRGGDGEGSSGEDEDDVDEPAVVYVEGQETLGKKGLTNGTAGRGVVDEDDDSAAGEVVISDSEEEESQEELEEGEEEELADAESLDEDEVDHDDVEDDEEEEEDESEGDDSRPPAKVRRVSERISKRK
ncbi:1486d64f-5ead-4657-a4b8-a48a50669458 [Thermothielavioides terrestris]|uniref:1486d64f-5ead-4657-a4b8-a48a50669458 n=1 Tax=Thermothielavioides terrestris TaxID=2587410 RepID=A0A446BX39_9PEZI|nr:1486d64f-5ead-4657-a4b8-a48a50669458 [Thermothielavioides terrestris]